MNRETPKPFTTSPQPQPLYITQPPLTQIIDWVLANPSIPLELRTRFHTFWEIVPLANLTERDIKYQMSKLREWILDLFWHIPEQKWGNKIQLKDDKGNVIWEGDLNLLATMLIQTYHIQLTRGKEGLTLRELNTIRSISSVRSLFEEERKKIRWI